MSLITYPIDNRGEMQDDTGSHHVSTVRQLSKPRKQAGKTKKPTQKATVTVLATDVNTTSANTFGTSLVDNDTLARIRKCLDRGHHAGTQEPEAKAALRIASKLMAKCNVTQAEVFACQDENQQAQHAGESVVAITSTKDGKKVINNGWIPGVQKAMQTFFDCLSYSTGFVSKTEYTFYGIAGNTAAAAMAFEMVYNLILNWSMLKIGVSTKFSYCAGVAQGLYRLAQKEKEEEKRNATRAEAESVAQREREELAQRDREIYRLNYNLEMPVSEPEEEEIQDITVYDDQSEISSKSSVSSGEERTADDSETEDEVLPDFDEEMEDTVDPSGNFESEIDKLRKRLKEEPSADETPYWSWTREGRENEGGDHVKDEPVYWSWTGEGNIDEGDDHVEVEADQHHEVAVSSPWASQMQLMAFRESAQKIAEDYIKKKDLKFSHRAKRTSEVRDYHAYGEGVKDSKKIDVRRRRLE